MSVLSYPIKILLARHGQTYWNVEQRLQGQLDSDLTPFGVEQAKILAAHLAQYKISVLFSSSLMRAQQTARQCANFNGVPLITCHSLMERNLGQWQNQMVSALENKSEYRQVFCQINSTLR